MMQFRPAAEARLGWLKQSKTRYSLSRCALRLDEKKAASNFIKHGLSFEEAATVFGDHFPILFLILTIPWKSTASLSSVLRNQVRFWWWHIRMMENRREGETTYTATGTYLEIERPHRLKYTYAMPQFSPNSDTISIEITPEEDGCVITFMQAGEDIANELLELPPGSTSASEAGWQQGFDLMAAAWEKPA